MAVNLGGLGELGAGMISPDPTLGTCSPTEASIRQSIPFTDIQISFPKFAGHGGGFSAKLYYISCIY